MPIPQPDMSDGSHNIDQYRHLKAGHHCVVDLAAEDMFVSPAILSNVLRSMIFRCCRSRLLMMPRVVKPRNALLTASSDIPRYSAMSDRFIGRYISVVRSPMVV